MAHTAITGPIPGIEAPAGRGRYGVYDHGAHVFAWQPDGERPVLWMSAASLFAAGEPLRGGIPVIFPWFGTGPAGDRNPPHGLVRLHRWQRVSLDDTVEQDGRLVVDYHLDPAGIPARDDLPPAFAAGLRVSFTPEYLDVVLTISNGGTAPFTFEEALHTYLGVSDVRQVTIHGLDGLTYLDRAAGAPSRTAVQDGPVTIESETDRIYPSRGRLILDDPGWQRRLLIDSQGSANTVVWNPWVAKAAAMPDFGAEEWTEMICIEAANVLDEAISLDPGGTHSMSQRVSLESR